MITRLERQQYEALRFTGCLAKTKTRTGREAIVYKNECNIDRPYYQLTVEGKTVFTRGTIGKVVETLERM